METLFTPTLAEAFQRAGLPYDGHEPEPGRYRRFRTNGNAHDTAGWLRVFPDGTGAAFGCWRAGESYVWQQRALNQPPPSDQERIAARAKAEAERKRAEEDRERAYAMAAENARRIWSECEPATSHEYLTRKGIEPHGARIYAGRLLALPVYDPDGNIRTLQFIWPTADRGGGTKRRFMQGGKATGGRLVLGSLVNGEPIVVAEGFATAASIFECTGVPVIVAFSGANMARVAGDLRTQYPQSPVIVAGDRDSGGQGRKYAEAALEACSDAVAVYPQFADNRADGDFNDLQQADGAEIVRRQIDAVLRTPSATAESSFITESAPIASDEMPAVDDGVTGVTGVHVGTGGGFSVTPRDRSDVTGVTQRRISPIPDETGRPAFHVFDDWEEHGGKKFRPGVWHFGIKPAKGDAPATLVDTFVCSPVHVEAVTFDARDNNFGRLLRFRNTLGRWREWAMPMELLRAAGDELRGELLAMGVEIDPTAKVLLANYLQSRHPHRHMRCALQVGWCDGSFVLPDTVIGPKASGVIFQSGERGHDEHTKAGTLAGWQQEIAARAMGNPLLILALSASFAGPLLERCNLEGGGIHFVGDSSTGKTTLIEAACATWGGPNYRRSWRATANGMEGAASLFNDCLLALDEISECDPREVGAIVYALGNGRGKQRASRSGSARGVARWRCVVVSSGERTIATAMQEGGFRAKAGQAVRLLDVPATRSFGAWDELQGAATGAAFSDAIKRAAATQHGYAGRAFLERLTRDERDLCTLMERMKALPLFAAEDGEGQDKRAAARFALFALAGEIATEYGVTGWPQGAAIAGAAVGFAAWRALRGRGNDERRQILDRVASFLERHGDARFSAADDDETQTRDRAGWWQDSPEGRTYLFTAEGMREAVKGFDFNRALDVLQEVGALAAPEADGKRSRPQRFGGRLVRVYPVVADKLGAHRGT